MTVTLKIEKNVYGGDGLGRLGDGRVCFVPGAFEGETVRAEITEQKKRYVKARLAEIVEASSDRREPGVVVPGMVYAGVSYEAEVRMKRDQLANFLQKAAPGAPAPTVVAAPQPLRYRNKVVYHTEKRNGAWVLGYRTEPEHHVVDTPQDPLACPEINAELPNIRAGVFALLTQGAKAVRQSARAADNVTVRWTPIDGVTWWLGEPPRGLELHETTDGRRFRVAAGGFYQVNPPVGDALVKAVREAYAAGAAEAPHILDLYCGVGVFGLACLAGGTAAEAPRLVGVESDRGAVACAKRNAAALRVVANFFCERVGASLGRMKAGPQHTVIADPPRGGMEPNVPGWLAARPARRLLYVSCDPATLARDLAALAKAYEVRDVRLFDMFPRTARFETLVTLERRGPA
ncbi:MAG: TRAM domain-containing protein [bacterium]|nr:TRAM domain-containing protein [bacterium]